MCPDKSVTYVGIVQGYERWSGIITDDQALRSFKFFVETAKVNMHASESCLAFARFTRPPKRPIEKKGEKAQVLSLINAGLTVPKVLDW